MHMQKNIMAVIAFLSVIFWTLSWAFLTIFAMYGIVCLLDNSNNYNYRLLLILVLVIAIMNMFCVLSLVYTNRKFKQLSFNKEKKLNPPAN